MMSRRPIPHHILTRRPRKHINPDTVTMAAALVFLAFMLVYQIATAVQP